MKRASIADVARHAGVSTATVSRALNTPDQVTEATLARVEAAIDALDYVRSETARSFKTQRSRMIMVVARNIGNIYYSELFRGVQRRAEALDHEIMIASPMHTSTDALIAAHLRTGRVDGVVVLSGLEASRVNTSVLREHYGGPPPIVGIGEERGHLALPHILVDNERAGYLAGKHLLAMGHTAIAHIPGPEGTPVRRARAGGLVRALAEAGLAPAWPEAFEGGFSIQTGRGAAQTMSARPDRPTAIFCANDEVALGFIAEATRLGIRVPKEVSVVGFDDIVFAEAAIPALTSIRQPREAMGMRAMDLVLALIEGERAEEMIELPLELVERDSVCPPGT
ncbi:LacI family DNA-binding transcriptional regulator [Pelagibacterium montanilacus]|uniref:LacI family DNA-binding transcriptional regulator n=1 Tax=Pelagibacterium montanilacus TaxID=2185280 RepID=UPI000F8CEF4E|nr:LacI family DNA-binding transcriptional regulator [Pelagibacterium montanilacus]